MESLESMAAALTAQYPAAESRSRQAIALVQAGAVERRPNSHLLQEDRYSVSGYTVSIAGGFCDCPDAASSAPRHNGGPLCKHRIAAMMDKRQAERQPGTPEETAQRLIAILEEAAEAGSDRLRLRVKVDYTYNRNTEQTNTLHGYLIPGAGRTWQKLCEGDNAPGRPSFRFTLRQLETALDGAGWRYITKNKAAGGFSTYGNEIWYFVRQTERDAQLDRPIATAIRAVAA